MTTYGTIPISTGGRGSSVSGSGSGGTNLEYISRAKAKLKEGLGTRRPWPQMFNLHSISLPRPLSEAIGRIKTNVAYFRMNYAIVVLLILFLSLLWHPISLIVFIALMAAWIVLYFLRDEPLVIFSRLIDDRVVLGFLAVVTIVLLLLTHATSNIIVSVMVGIVVVLIHAILRNTDDLNWDEEEEAGGLFPSTGASYR